MRVDRFDRVDRFGGVDKGLVAEGSNGARRARGDTYGATTAGLHGEADSVPASGGILVLLNRAARGPIGLLARLRDGDDERGSALIELIFLGVFMSIPMFYLIVALARLQAGTYAATTAAREATRAFVTSPSSSLAYPRARAAADLAFADQSFRGGRIDLACAGSACLQRGSVIRSTASVEVPLPLVPSFLRAVIPTQITINATHVETVDPYRAEP